MKKNIFVIVCVLIVYAIITFLSCQGYEKDIPSPKIFFNLPDSLVEAKKGDTIYFTPKITYDFDSQYKWYVNNQFISSERSFMHISKQLGEIFYAFTVTTPKGFDSVSLIVRTIELIDFNNFPLKEESYDIGEKLQEEDGFKFGFLSLPNKVLPEKKWEGFAMSNMYGTQIYKQDTIYSVFGSNKANKVFTMLSLSQSPELNSFIFKNDSSYLIGNIDVCNTTRVYNMIVHGDGDKNKPFGRIIDGYHGDSLCVRFSGYDYSGNFKGNIDFFLADYRFERNSDVYVIRNFTQVDLSSLGFINKLVINMFSSLNDETRNMFLPPFVCFDNIKIFDKQKN